MTYSIGFRAPSRAELIAGWTEHLVAELDDDDRYGDPGLAAQDNPGEISSAALERLQAMVAERVVDRTAFAHWFGEYSTAPKVRDIDWRPEQPLSSDEVRASVRRGIPVLRNPASRFSFVRSSPENLTLFVDGNAYDCTGPSAVFAGQLCAATRLRVDPDVVEREEGLALLEDLVNHGSAIFDPEK
jgi:50S ribosomal protein L16 3-hydroxylase